jgi:riboflavin kinase, archaea type
VRSNDYLRGQVVSGLGNFSFWIEKLEDYYFRKTGLHFYPGTLNVLLDHAWSVPAGALRLEKEEYGGSVSVSLVPCRIFDLLAFILRTDLNESGSGPHPKNLIEVAAEIRLRDTYSLKDGDVVEIEILSAQ